MKRPQSSDIVMWVVALGFIPVSFSQNMPVSSSDATGVVPADSQAIIPIGDAMGPMCIVQTWKWIRVGPVKTKFHKVVHSQSNYRLSARLTADRSLNAKAVALLTSCAAKAADMVGQETIASQQYEAADVLRSLINKCVLGERWELHIVGVKIDRQQICSK